MLDMPRQKGSALSTATLGPRGSVIGNGGGQAVLPGSESLGEGHSIKASLASGGLFECGPVLPCYDPSTDRRSHRRSVCRLRVSLSQNPRKRESHAEESLKA